MNTTSTTPKLPRPLSSNATSMSEGISGLLNNPSSTLSSNQSSNTLSNTLSNRPSDQSAAKDSTNPITSHDANNNIDTLQSKNRATTPSPKGKSAGQHLPPTKPKTKCKAKKSKTDKLTNQQLNQQLNGQLNRQLNSNLINQQFNGRQQFGQQFGNSLSNPLGNQLGNQLAGTFNGNSFGGQQQQQQQQLNNQLNSQLNQLNNQMLQNQLAQQFGGTGSTGNQMNGSNQFSSQDILNLMSSHFNKLSANGGQASGSLQSGQPLFANQLSPLTGQSLSSQQLVNHFGKFNPTLNDETDPSKQQGNFASLCRSNSIGSHLNQLSQFGQANLGGNLNGQLNGQLSSQLSNLAALNNLNAASLMDESKCKDENDIKSLMCDKNGIVFAETVYRCTVCSKLNELITDAKQHFRLNHMSPDCPMATMSFNSLTNIACFANLRNLLNTYLGTFANLNGTLNSNNAASGLLNSLQGNLQLNGLPNGLPSSLQSSLQKHLANGNLTGSLANGLGSNGNLSNGLPTGLIANGFGNLGGVNQSGLLSTAGRSRLPSGLSKMPNLQCAEKSLYRENSSNHQTNNENAADETDTNSGDLCTMIDRLKTDGTFNNPALLAVLNNNNSAFPANSMNPNNLAFCINNLCQEQLIGEQEKPAAGESSYYSSDSPGPINTSSDAPTTPTGKSNRNAESCTKTGYITCPVCSSMRFYTTLQRRYGQFTCVACYRFFKEFFLKPQRYACPELSKCALNTKQRCKACWIHSCAKVYSVDSKRKAILEKYHPIESINLDTSQQMVTDEEPAKSGDDQPNAECSERSEPSQTANSSPVTNEEDDELMDEDEDGSLKDEERPLDFTTGSKTLCWPVKNEQPSNDLNQKRSAFDSVELPENGKPDSDQSGSADVPEAENLKENDTRTFLSSMANGDQTNVQRHSIHPANQPTQTNLKPESSLPSMDTGHRLTEFQNQTNSFMQMNRMNQIDELTDWNNNSLPSMLNGDLNSLASLKHSKHSNGRLDQHSLNLNDLAALNGFGRELQDFSVLNGYKDPFADSPLNKKAKARVKNWSCLKCANCKAPDCGQCANCMDRKKNGGSFIRKQRCVMKRCLVKNATLKEPAKLVS